MPQPLRLRNERIGSLSDSAVSASGSSDFDWSVRTEICRVFAETGWMANPFSATETEYPVETPNMTCYANCAWLDIGFT